MSVMIDIETLGTESGCAVLSVGAVEFDTDGVGYGYHESISLTSCEAAGLHIDAETLEWWLAQDEEAREVLSGGDDLEDVLQEFSDFVEGHEEVWANSPSFDCAILEHAFDAVGLEVPWEFYHERCFRTLKKLPVSVDIEQEGEEHDALADAWYQARVASEILSKLEAANTQHSEIQE